MGERKQLIERPDRVVGRIAITTGVVKPRMDPRAHWRGDRVSHLVRQHERADLVLADATELIGGLDVVVDAGVARNTADAPDASADRVVLLGGGSAVETEPIQI